MILNDTFYTFSLNLLVFGFYLYLAGRYNCILVIFRIENSKAFDFEIGICEKKNNHGGWGVEGFLNVQIAFKTDTHYL